MFQTQSKTGENLEEELVEDDDTSKDSPISGLKVDVLGMMFVFFYLLILLIQFVGMMMHRWGTFLHLVSVTKLRNPFDMVVIFVFLTRASPQII